MKTKNFVQGCGPELEKPSRLSFRVGFRIFCCMALTACLSASSAATETSSEQLDPLDMLVPYLAADSQDANTSTSSTPRHKDASVDAPRAPTHDAGPQHKQPEQQQETQTGIDAGKDSAVAVNNELLNPAASESSDTKPGQLLKRTAIASFKAEKPSNSKTELQQMIEQLRSVKFEPRKKTPEPLIVVQVDTKTEPNEISPAAELLDELEQESLEHKAKLPYEPLTNQTLQLLEKLSQQPEQLKNAYELAEVLFRSGHLNEAARCYQEALNREGDDRPDLTRNKAWILFQIGNCLQNEDPPTAIRTYRQLIKEYPDSLWADLANARINLIGWYLQDSPKTLIKESSF